MSAKKIESHISDVKSSPEVLSIQYLRAIGAIMVVVYHIGQIFGHDYLFGAAGVDIFFVISGFIMWMISRKKEATPSIFIKKRLLRIVPLYWLVTLTLVTGALLRPNLFPLDHPTVTHVYLSLLFIPHIDPSGNVFPMITQGWTLNYEMFFYLIFSTSMVCSRKYQLYVLNTILLGCVIFGYFITLNSPIGKAYTSPLLLEFLAGIYICQAWLNNKILSIKTAYVALALGISVIVASYLIFLTSPPPRLIVAGIPAVLIVSGAVSLEKRKKFPKIGLLKLLGDASYSIYLTHFLSWLAISIILAKLNIGLNTTVYILTIFVCIIGGVITYVCIEKPYNLRLINQKSVARLE